jgi:hypothetical protein
MEGRIVATQADWSSSNWHRHYHGEDAGNQRLDQKWPARRNDPASPSRFGKPQGENPEDLEYALPPFGAQASVSPHPDEAVSYQT